MQFTLKYTDNKKRNITHEFDAEILDDVLEEITYFLKGISYSFDGELQVVNDFDEKLK